MAGMFTSVSSVRSWAAFLDAVDAVLASSQTVAVRTGQSAPIAVLVQPQLEAEIGGVMFGFDPLTGRRDRLLVSAVPGTPEKLVQGEADDARYLLTRSGRLVERTGTGGATLTRKQRRALAALATQAAKTFRRPQDIEWGIDADGALWLLQSRPITAAREDAKPRGPVFGPGPVAETFPHALSPLEEDLWVAPLHRAIGEALVVAGAASRRRLARSPALITIGGRVAVDLQLLGASPRRASLLAKLDPRAPARRLLASWRVGRLRAALPALAEDVVQRADDEMAKLPELATLTAAQLVALLRGLQAALVALHGHEVLVGLLLRPDSSAPTAASVALRALSLGRAEAPCGRWSCRKYLFTYVRAGLKIL